MSYSKRVRPGPVRCHGRGGEPQELFAVGVPLLPLAGPHIDEVVVQLPGGEQCRAIQRRRGGSWELVDGRGQPIEQ